jgi:small subunit ribosomal protein S6
MRTYENIIIVHPDKVGDEYAAVLEKFKGVLGDLGANLLKVDEWGVRKLAYPVKKQIRGSYVLTVFESQPEALAEFERRLRLDEAVIKFQTIVLEKGFVETAAAAEESTEEKTEQAAEETAE